MKTTRLGMVVLFMLLTSIAAQAQNRIVEKPASMHSNTTTVEIGKVTLTDTATVVDIEAFFQPGWWIRIVSDSYLLADGKKYMIRDGEGIDLDSLFWMPASGEASFRLIFDPLPGNTRTFDFIESDCADCFKIWGVDLVNDRVALPEIPVQYRHNSQPEEEIAVGWERGKAKVSGLLLGYAPRYGMNARLVYPNPVTGQETLVPVALAEDGTFHSEIEMYSPAHLYLTYDAPQADRFGFIAAPGEETAILVNLPEANRERSRLHNESANYGNKVMFAGYQSKLNEELNHDGFITDIYTDDFLSDIVGYSPLEYHDHVLGRYREGVANNNALDVSSRAKKIRNMQLAFEANHYLMASDNYLLQAYMDKNKVQWDQATKEVGPLTKHDTYNDYLVEIPYPYNDPDLLLVQRLPYYLGMLSYASSPSQDRYGFLRYLAGSGEVKTGDQEILEGHLQRLEEEEVLPDSTVLAVLLRYRDLQEKYLGETMGVNYLSTVWNTHDCLLFDLMTANKISRKMEDFYPLDEAQQKAIESFNPVMRDVLLEKNQELLAKIEENKQKTGYTVLEVPGVANEELFAEIDKPYKGKTVLVDVWATWCGPCRMANKAMEPLKAQLADKDIIYLYLAGEDSPENTWRNMIPDLKGHHYRVNESAWNYFRQSLKARGVPTYIVLDKEGNQSFHSSGFPGVDTMKRELLKALEE